MDRIAQKPDVMGGKACVRGLRVTVAMIVNQMQGALLTVDANQTRLRLLPFVQIGL